jgi:mannose-6-phosphate isomerase-like protein (cupin superfamily)
MPLISKTELSPLELPGRTLRIIPMQAENSSESFNFIFTDILPGNSLPVHTHENEAEAMYIIAGNPETECDGEIKKASPGEVFIVPRRCKHTVRNKGNTPVQMFCVFSPPVDTGPFYKLAKKD